MDVDLHVYRPGVSTERMGGAEPLRLVGVRLPSVGQHKRDKAGHQGKAADVRHLLVCRAPSARKPG
jgi:hypothetical protein